MPKIPRDSPLYKYWAQRYNLFSRYDDGIKLDDEAWYSVTPERIAKHISERVHNALGDGHKVILDAFCGVGGNLIQFALHSPLYRVIGVDIDPVRIKMAKHNAKIYGVAHQCDFILADFLDVVHCLDSHRIDAVFLSPPWGGIDYQETKKYSLGDMSPNGHHLVRLCRKYITPNIAFLAPRNTDLDDVCSELLEKAHPFFECEQNMIGLKTKTIVLYFGGLAEQSPDCDS